MRTFTPSQVTIVIDKIPISVTIPIAPHAYEVP